MAPGWLEKFIVRADASPDARRTSEKPTLNLQYHSVADHRRTLTVEGETTPLYEVTRQSVLGAWGSKIHITAPRDGDKDVALIQYNTFSYQIKFPARNGHRIDMSYGKRAFKASGNGLGTLTWKGTGMEVAGAASWELRAESELVMVVSVDATQADGSVTLWKEDLDAQTVEELVMVGASQIEEYKRMLRNSNKSSVRAVVNAQAV